jgi:hypothetical protein
MMKNIRTKVRDQVILNCHGLKAVADGITVRALAIKFF